MIKLYTYQETLDDIAKNFPGGMALDLMPWCKPEDPIRERYRFRQLLSEHIDACKTEMGITTPEEFQNAFQEIMDSFTGCIIFPTDVEPIGEDVSIYVSDFLNQEFKKIGQVPITQFRPDNVRAVIKEAGREYVRYFLCMSDIFIPLMQERKVDA